MEAGEVKVRIEVDAVIVLTTATVTLRVKGPADAVFRELSMTVSVPANIAIRDTLASDFPVSGNYFIQLRAVFPDSRDLLSPVSLIHIGEVVASLCG